MPKWILWLWSGVLTLILLVSIPQCTFSGDGTYFNMKGQQSTFDPQGPIAANQIDLFYLVLWLTIFLFVTVGGALAYAIWRFREKKTDDPNYIPPQSHGHPLIEVGLVLASTVLLIIIAIPTFKGIILKKTIPEHLQADAIEINVTGYQWWWGFEYPEHGFHTANEIVFPAGRAVKLNLVANDVIHSFWLPKLAGKVDLIPGQNNQMWIMADEPGYFWGQCAEYCGSSHAYMLFRAIALNEEDWNAWVARQQTATVITGAQHLPVAATTADSALAEQITHGAQLFVENCVRCHSVDSKVQTMGPNLAHFGSRSAIAAGWLENKSENLHRWIKEPDQIKPGNFMWYGFPNPRVPGEVLMEGLKDAQLSDAEVDAIVTYLNALQ